jgi:adenine-specific DNA-methyltransferase
MGLERLVRSSSNENDLVLDAFCGSGTRAAVAEKLNRRWIACDLGRFAIHATRKRLLSVPNLRPFIVQNLGKYERQVWAGAEFGTDSGAQAIKNRIIWRPSSAVSALDTACKVAFASMDML